MQTYYTSLNLSQSIGKLKNFSKGSLEQHKNYKNMLNLCYHKCDFNLEACWLFFATSHGKSPCDSVMETVKQAKTASLQRPMSD